MKLFSLAHKLNSFSHKWLFTRPRFDKEVFSVISCPKMNDIIDARGFYLILGAKVETFNRYEAYFKREAFILINVTNYTKLICFR